MPIRLLTSLYQYPEKAQRRLMASLEELNFSLQEKADLLRDIESWLSRGVNAPTALESATGWHKNFNSFWVEGDEGSDCINRLLASSDRKKRGVDLDSWKPPAAKKPSSKT
jgi:hypothetical protein